MIALIVVAAKNADHNSVQRFMEGLDSFFREVCPEIGLRFNDLVTNAEFDDPKADEAVTKIELRGQYKVGELFAVSIVKNALRVAGLDLQLEGAELPDDYEEHFEDVDQNPVWTYVQQVAKDHGVFQNPLFRRLQAVK